MKLEKLNIEGMYCGHCANLVKNSLSLVKGVSNAHVTIGSATVSYDETVTEKEDIEKAITRFGYRIRD